MTFVCGMLSSADMGHMGLAVARPSSEGFDRTGPLTQEARVSRKAITINASLMEWPLCEILNTADGAQRL
jgi:hypothetical protein